MLSVISLVTCKIMNTQTFLFMKNLIKYIFCFTVVKKIKRYIDLYQFSTFLGGTKFTRINCLKNKSIIIFWTYCSINVFLCIDNNKERHYKFRKLQYFNTPLILTLCEKKLHAKNKITVTTNGQR
jgi:hypothetical protein